MNFISRLAASSTSGSRRARRVGGEDGYILIGVLFLVVMVLFALSIAAPKVAADLERDREIELMHRGKQYQRAIQLYYRKFQKYPPNMEALEKTNEIRFLRRRYRDPITRKDEWHLIHYGEAKTPTMGLFGQPLAGLSGTGSPLAGIGPGGSGQGLGSPIGGAGSTAGGGLFNSSPGSGIGGGSQGGSLFGNSPSSSNSGISGQTGTGATNNPTSPDPNAGTNGNNGANGSNAGGQNGGSNTTDPNGQNGSSGSTSSGGLLGSSSGSGNGLVIGGGGVIGVESTSPKKAILEYKKKTHFNEWEFVYDPMADMQTISGGGGPVGAPIGGAGAGTTPGIGGIGNQGIGNGGIGNGGIGNGGIGNGGIGNGGTGSQPPTPTPQPPQQ